MTQKQKLEELKKRGYTLEYIMQKVAELRVPDMACAIRYLFDYEMKFTAKQNTLELGELEANPFLNDNQGDLF